MWRGVGDAVVVEAVRAAACGGGCVVRRGKGAGLGACVEVVAAGALERRRRRDVAVVEVLCSGGGVVPGSVVGVGTIGQGDEASRGRHEWSTTPVVRELDIRLSVERNVLERDSLEVRRENRSEGSRGEVKHGAWGVG